MEVETVITEEVAIDDSVVSAALGVMSDDELFGEDKKVVIPSDKKSGSEVPAKKEDKTSLKKEDLPPAKTDKAEKPKKEFTFDKEKYSKLTPEELVAELEKTQKEAHGQSSLIGKKGKEIGDVKKANEALQKQLESLQKKILTEKEIEDLEIESPRKAVKAERESEDAEKEIKRIQIQQQINRNQALVLNDMPDFEDHIEAIAEIIKTDGEPEAAEMFKKNPFIAQPAVLLNLRKRVQMGIEMSEMKEGYEKQLKDLQAKYDKLTSNTRYVTDSIKKSSKVATLGNLPSNSDNGKKRISNIDISLMKDEDLND